jgi:hypothetical protein
MKDEAGFQVPDTCLLSDCTLWSGPHAILCDVHTKEWAFRCPIQEFVDCKEKEPTAAVFPCAINGCGPTRPAYAKVTGVKFPALVILCRVHADKWGYWDGSALDYVRRTNFRIEEEKKGVPPNGEADYVQSVSAPSCEIEGCPEKTRETFAGGGGAVPPRVARIGRGLGVGLLCEEHQRQYHADDDAIRSSLADPFGCTSTRPSATEWAATKNEIIRGRLKENLPMKNASDRQAAHAYPTIQDISAIPGISDAEMNLRLRAGASACAVIGCGPLDAAAVRFDTASGWLALCPHHATELEQALLVLGAGGDDGGAAPRWLSTKNDALARSKPFAPRSTGSRVLPLPLPIPPRLIEEGPPGTSPAPGSPLRVQMDADQESLRRAAGRADSAPMTWGPGDPLQNPPLPIGSAPEVESLRAELETTRGALEALQEAFTAQQKVLAFETEQRQRLEEVSLAWLDRFEQSSLGMLAKKSRDLLGR